MSFLNKKRIKEIYFYKIGNQYKLDLLDSKSNLIKSNLNTSSKEDVNKFIDLVKENKHKKFQISKMGLKIYNKRPVERLLSLNSTSNLFDSYLRNLSSLKENKNYTNKVSKLLRSVADLIDDESINSIGTSDINISKDPEYHISVPGIEPEDAVNSIVPMELISRIQETLNTSINLKDLTFYFQDQKWSLTKDGFEQDNLPEPKRPKTSHVILSGMQHMMNLLGVNSETNSEIGENSFVFVEKGGVYKISHIYTGDHNTIRREI